MTTVHMDVGAARGLQKEIMRLHSSIARIVQSTNSTINGLPQHWRGSSAIEFMGLYNDSISQISGLLEPLSELAAKLTDEIDRMERIAEKLSD